MCFKFSLRWQGSKENNFYCKEQDLLLKENAPTTIQHKMVEDVKKTNLYILGLLELFCSEKDPTDFLLPGANLKV